MTLLSARLLRFLLLPQCTTQPTVVAVVAAVAAAVAFLFASPSETGSPFPFSPTYKLAGKTTIRDSTLFANKVSHTVFSVEILSPEALPSLPPLRNPPFRFRLHFLLHPPRCF